MDRGDIDLTIRTAASITFKNVVKGCWETDEKISPQDRQQVKVHIVKLMLNTPENIQRQLSEAIAMIGRVDFHEKWLELLPEINSIIQSDDFSKTNGCLRTVHSLFKRYRFEIKSNELWTEIKYVLDNFAEPLTKLFERTLIALSQSTSNPDQLKVIYQTLGLIAKIFYSLNYQDLPEFFEDNIKIWMEGFYQLLVAPNIAALESDSDDQAGPQEILKAQICENVAMYATKYGEEFEGHLAQFVQAIWTLLTSTGRECKYVSTIFGFLGSVSERNGNGRLFSEGDDLKFICEQTEESVEPETESPKKKKKKKAKEEEEPEPESMEVECSIS